MSKVNEPGTHFITLMIEKNRIIVLDSLALRLNVFCPELLKVLLESGKDLTYAFDTPIQSPNSGHCGIYCLYFVCYVLKSKFPIRHNLTPFRNSATKMNDRIAVSNFNKLIVQNM